MNYFASLWFAIKTRQVVAAQIAIGLLLFGGGWQLGRVMSPYYAAHPIIFEDRECGACENSGGNLEEITKLKINGIAERTPNVSVTPTAAVASATTDIEERREYVASVNSNLYHHRTCASANRIKEENRVWFSTKEEAEVAGYSASKCTKDLPDN